MTIPIIAGVDEAGRGPWAGPVFAAAVILDTHKPIAGLADSKVLSAKKREALCWEIQQKAAAWAVGRAEVAEIDQLNILQATLLAMRRAITALTIRPDAVQVDGNAAPKIDIQVTTIVNGDALVPAISAASIIAKVLRDRLMLEYAELYPQYGFAQHKGYGTKVHLAALQQYGICPIHRRSFAPIAKLLNLSQ